jgi:tRNA A-37 threonylcarbamoyl transferase component Bud32
MTTPEIVDYRIVREIASGGMGTVYEAVHVKLGRKVAIKVVHPERARDPEVELRFLNEARALARVSHPSIVQIFTFGVLADGASYLVMELLEGETLAQRWQRLGGALDWLTELRLLHQIADLLAILHRFGVIHRDLKPENVMCVLEPIAPRSVKVKLVDFGIAKLVRLSGPKSVSSLIMGTPAYMSPEQCRGAGEVDSQTDCYALGVMLYELMAGHLPFMSPYPGDLIGMHLHVEPQPLAKLVPDIDPRLCALIHSLLDKNKERRPAMSQVADYLGKLLSQLTLSSNKLRVVQSALNEALAPTLTGPPVGREQVDDAQSRLEAAMEQRAREVPPTQEYLDALFKHTCRARILEGGVFQGEPVGTIELLVVESADLPQLQKALQVKEVSALRRCSCIGDFTLELCSSEGRVALFAFHSHEGRSLSNVSWDRDAELVGTDALLTFFSDHNLVDVGRRILSGRKGRTRRPWLEFRLSYDEEYLQSKQHQEELDRAYRESQKKAQLARTPEQELLPQLSEKLLRDRVVNARSYEKLSLTVESLLAPEVFSTRMSLLARITSKVWERLQLHAKNYRSKQSGSILLHARRVSESLQTIKPRYSEQTGSELIPISKSALGPLTELVTDGINLYSVAQDKLLRISISDGKMTEIVDLPGPDIELSCCGPSLLFTCKTVGTVGRLHVNESRFEVLATGRENPSLPTHCHWQPHWVETRKDQPGHAVLTHLVTSDSTDIGTSPLSPTPFHPLSLTWNSSFLYYLNRESDRSAALHQLSINGDSSSRLSATPTVKEVFGAPILAITTTHVFWLAGATVRWTSRLLSHDSRLRAAASGPIVAIAPCDQGIYVVVGRGSDKRWHIEFAETGKTTTKRLGSFMRRSSDRLAAVTWRDSLYFICGESLYAVRSN